MFKNTLIKRMLIVLNINLMYYNVSQCIEQHNIYIYIYTLNIFECI